MKAVTDASIHLLKPKPGAVLPPDVPDVPIIVWVEFADDDVEDLFLTPAKAQEAAEFFKARPAPGDRKFGQALEEAVRRASQPWPGEEPRPS